MNVSTTAGALGVATKTVWRLINQRKISFYRIGRRVLISREQLAEFLREREISAFDAGKEARDLLAG